MSPQQILLLAALIFFGGLILLILLFIFIKRKQIDQFLHPNRWYSANIITEDGPILTEIVRYPEDKPIYKESGRLHFLTSKRFTQGQRQEALNEMSDEERGNLQIEDFEEVVTPHRIGRHVAYFWGEHDPFPKDLRSGDTLLDPALLQKFEDLKLSEAFGESNPVNPVNVILIIGVIVIIVLLILVLTKKPDTAVQAAKTVTDTVVVR